MGGCRWHKRDGDRGGGKIWEVLNADSIIVVFIDVRTVYEEIGGRVLAFIVAFASITGVVVMVNGCELSNKMKLACHMPKTNR